jgi:UDP-N-acetylmuramoyl-L-alanyl-D-glutamate--2,6-diaminopimelate ligase
MLERLKRLIPRRIFKALQPAYHFIFSWLASLVFAFPSNKLIVIGVTGTAGKTSTVYLIAKILSQAGYKTGFTSTAVFSDGEREWLNDQKMTMPGRWFIQRTLRQMVRNKCVYAIIETTSEGIKQFRHRFINYDSLLFTGLYPEHIEAHGSFAKYKQVKGRLFAHLKHCSTKYINEKKIVCRPSSELKKLDLRRVSKTIIVSGDDEQADYFLDFWSEIKLAYSFKPEVNRESFLKKLKSEATVKDFMVVHGEAVETSATGTKFTVSGLEINLPLLGEFNALNGLAAYTVGLSQAISPTEIKAGLESVKGLAGKLEIIKVGQNFTAVVDYSFEPRALEKLYGVLELIPHKRLIHLLGSTGGGRDKSRRPILGRLAAAKADLVIVTNEDPYDEDPAEIINQVASGAEMAGKENGRNLFKILDRQTGIKKALELAREGDLVLFTGKGAEQYICLNNGQKIPWDEREIVKKEILNILGTKAAGS